MKEIDRRILEVQQQVAAEFEQAKLDHERKIKDADGAELDALNAAWAKKEQHFEYKMLSLDFLAHDHTV